LPYIFQKPHCNTCVHWKLLNAEALDHIAISSPNEYDEIIKCFEGKRGRIVRDKGTVEDFYNEFRFFGWCKRFPPVYKQEGDYSIIRLRTLFSLLNSFNRKRIGEYGFPLMPHDEVCGEWKKDDWVDDWIKEHISK
jgi:hypothetical protein